MKASRLRHRGFTTTSLHGCGFTLIELMVVISIIAILISLAIVSIVGVQKSSRDNKRKADLEEVRSALEKYRTDNRTYPNKIATLQPAYLSILPIDPVKTNLYAYTSPSSDTYVLCAYLETQKGSSCNYAVGPMGILSDFSGCNSGCK